MAEDNMAPSASPAPASEIARLLWDAAKAIQWHLEPNSPDEHEALMKRLYAAARNIMNEASASPAALTDEQREKVCEAVADALGDAYDCMRVWSAWGAGTMGSDDFALVAEDDSRVAEIADAAIAATLATSSVAAVPAAPQPSAKALTDEPAIWELASKFFSAESNYEAIMGFARALLAAEQPTELPRHALEAWRAVVRERRRQIAEEGWTPEHDDEHRDYAMSCAAGCYAMYTLAYPAGDPPPQWPWAAEWWKPKDHRRNLERAGALILAELERDIRAKQKDAAIAKGEQ